MTATLTPVAPTPVQIQTNEAARAAKQHRLRFGKAGGPIPATRVLYKPMENFSDPKVKAECWIIENSKTGTVTFANTYDGIVGRDWDPSYSTFQIASLDAKKHAKRTKGYKEVPISDCFLATPAEEVKTA